MPSKPSRVYALIADYHNGHPHILPKEFSELVVEKGGVGRGTIIRFQTSVFGRKHIFRAAISEPEPGRVLAETDLDTNGEVTTFIVDRDSASGHSRVTITRELAVRKGLAGKIFFYAASAAHLRAGAGPAGGLCEQASRTVTHFSAEQREASRPLLPNVGGKQSSAAGLVQPVLLEPEAGRPARASG